MVKYLDSMSDIFESWSVSLLRLLKSGILFLTVLRSVVVAKYYAFSL